MKECVNSFAAPPTVNYLCCPVIILENQPDSPKGFHSDGDSIKMCSFSIGKRTSHRQRQLCQSLMNLIVSLLMWLMLVWKEVFSRSALQHSGMPSSATGESAVSMYRSNSDCMPPLQAWTQELSYIELTFFALDHILNYAKRQRLQTSPLHCSFIKSGCLLNTVFPRKI